jgi:hypothetical protein
VSYLEHVRFHSDDQTRRGVHALVHLAVRTFAEHTELCVLAEFGLSQLDQRRCVVNGLDYLGMAVLREGIPAHACVPFGFVCLF